MKNFNIGEIRFDKCFINLEGKFYQIIAKKEEKSPATIKNSIKYATEIMYYENEEKRIKDYVKENNKENKNIQPKMVIKTILNKICK